MTTIVESKYNLKNLVDLHVHLGSSSTPHFLWEIAHAQGLKLPEKDYDTFVENLILDKPTSYNKYLNYFELSEHIQSSVWAVERSVHNAISLSYRKANITKVEIRFDPMLRNRNDEQDLDKIILAATIGMKKACIEYPVEAGLILMMDRRFSKEKNRNIVRKAIQFKKEGVVGIDIGGPLNDNFKAEDVVDLYNMAQKNGLKTTFHTGEVTGIDEMWKVMKNITPDRIGHGIKCVEDKKLMKYIVENDIVLELCPTSNIITSAVKSWEEFGEIVNTLRENKVKFTINSDGPVFLQTNVKLEYEKLIDKGILSVKEAKAINKLAHEVSFI